MELVLTVELLGMVLSTKRDYHLIHGSGNATTTNNPFFGCYFGYTHESGLFINHFFPNGDIQSDKGSRQ